MTAPGRVSLSTPLRPTVRHEGKIRCVQGASTWVNVHLHGLTCINVGRIKTPKSSTRREKKKRNHLEANSAGKHLYICSRRASTQFANATRTGWGTTWGESAVKEGKMQNGLFFLSSNRFASPTEQIKLHTAVCTSTPWAMPVWHYSLGGVICPPPTPVGITSSPPNRTNNPQLNNSSFS